MYHGASPKPGSSRSVVNSMLGVVVVRPFAAWRRCASRPSAASSTRRLISGEPLNRTSSNAGWKTWYERAVDRPHTPPSAIFEPL